MKPTNAHPMRVPAAALTIAVASAAALAVRHRGCRPATPDLLPAPPELPDWLQRYSPLSVRPPRWTFATWAGARVIARRMIADDNPDRDVSDRSWGFFSAQATLLLAAHLIAASANDDVFPGETQRWLTAESPVEVLGLLARMESLGVPDAREAGVTVRSIWSLAPITRDAIASIARRAVSSLATRTVA